MPGFVRPILIALGALVAIAGALFFISRGAVLGSPVYPVKLAFEEARLSLTFGVFPKARWYITLAERRTQEGDELRKAGEKKLATQTFGKANEYVNLSYRYTEHLIDGAQREEISRRGETTRRKADELLREMNEVGGTE